MFYLSPMRETNRSDIPIYPDSEFDPGRRRFLNLMAASLALAGSGCSGPPTEQILPYVRMPEDVLPGQPTFYASALTRQGYGLGVLVESNMGRPTKVEGNPQHPASRGATDVFAQADVLRFWDPDRSQVSWQGGQIVSWETARSALLERGVGLRRQGGEGLRILTGTQTSESFAAQWRILSQELPAARWHCYEPLHDDGAYRAAQLAFRRPVDTLLHLDRARVVASFGADFLGQAAGPWAVAYSQDFAALRRDHRRPGRLYAVDVAASLTGANADERLTLAPASAERLVWRLAAALGMGEAGFPTDPVTAPWEAALARELLAHRGEGLLVAGPYLSPETRALVHALNHFLGNAGRTVDYIAPVESAPGHHVDSMAVLVRDMAAGRVDTLLIIGGNPVYDAPATIGFAEALARVPNSFHTGLYRDETALLCGWHLPLAHEFEHWGDVRAHDGTHSIIQPVISPLHGARSAREILAMLGTENELSDYAAVRRSLGQLVTGRGNFEAAWISTLREGLLSGSAAAPLRLPSPGRPRPPRLEETPLTAVFMPDPSVGDGRYANNAWLQELPRPITTLTWDNAALLGPVTARTLGLENGQVAEISADGHSVRAPVWVLPGQAEGTVGIPLGYGRRAAGRVGDKLGFDGYRLKGVGNTAPVALQPTGERHTFACRQPWTSQEGRDLARHATATRFRDAPDLFQEKRPMESLYPAYDYPEYAWAMVIDLNACIGCGACTIACQAENNIPVVGKEQVSLGREMHWIRVDRYYPETRDAGPVLFQPVPCMHCENAPCEPVCPVGATVHDSEGLNVQVYNRCVGTRYCSNNCPYKVRRFNFLQYSNTDVESLKAGMNPEVTVRRRGVMEKCNFCLQRITRARIAAEVEGRRIADGEVVTACEAVCPTRAIVFGDLNTPDSRVNRSKASPLNYALLAELNTRPRTTYLARIINPDPDLQDV
ncbi:MAG: 4Fe-4S dicluster domain-containing protein [Bacteroidota bacterium]